MADKQFGPNLFANWPLFAAVLAIGTYFVSHPETPIQGSRPATAAKPMHGVEQLQDVDARLWQDPFGAMWRDIDSQPSNGSQTGKSSSANNDVPIKDCSQQQPLPQFPHSCPPVGPADKMVILGVMLPGAPFPEDEEIRRQVRYAVVSSLSVKSYVPNDEEHIGYFRVKLPQEQPAAAKQEMGPQPHEAPKAEEPQEWGSSWIDTAFEAFHSPDNKRLLVLWINEEQLAKAAPIDCGALYGLSSLKQQLRVSKDSSIAFLGPWGSSTLKGMVSEVKTCKSKSVDPLTIYNFSATAEEDLLAPTGGSETLSDYFGKNVRYSRTIATDLDVVQLIKNELTKRGINSSEKNSHDHVVLISEGDSFYGQNLPKSIGKALNLSPCSDQLHCFSYLRGLDGQLPDARASAAKPPARDGQDETASGDQTRNGQPLSRTDLSRNIERPEGNGQYDYVRRLRSKISELDRQLRKDGKGQIRAIGVVGSDVYDKLVVLQLLRPDFPDAVFFTTDLDARLYHPKELGWSRNLIVASAYGLELRDDLQGRIPPFRSVYQTSAFLATRLALDDASPDQKNPTAPLDWINHPVLFEVGMASPFAFALPTKPDDDKSVQGKGAGQAPAPTAQTIIAENTSPASAAPAQVTDACASDLRRCKRVMPLPTSLFPTLPSSETQFLGWAGVVGIIFLGFGLLLSRRIRDSFTYSGAGNPRLMHPLLVVVIFFIGGILACSYWQEVGSALTGDGYGEPMLLLAGISVWPEIVLRSIIILCALVFTVRGFRRLDSNLLVVAQKFGLDEPRTRPAGFRRSVWRLWQLFGRGFHILFHASELREIFSCQLLKHGSHGKPLDRFWKCYLQRGRTPARFFRVSVATVVVMVLYLILEAIFGSPAPIARQYSLRLLDDVLSWTEAATTWFLVFFVADATLFCVRFVSEINNFDSSWSDETVARFNTEFNLDANYVDRWIDLNFVGARSKCIITLATYPFFVLALIILSRSTFFGNYSANWPVFIMAAAGFLTVFGCVAVLAWAAERERRSALDKGSSDLIDINRRKVVTSGSPDPIPAHMEMLLRRIQDFQEGAFKPFSQQPIVKAVLLPAGGLGGTALLNNLPLLLGV